MYGFRKCFAVGVAMGLAVVAVPRAHADHGGGARHRGHGPGHDHGRLLEKAIRHLDLTEAQEVEVRRIFEETHAKAEAIDARRLTGAERREAFRELHEAAMGRVKALLTAEQQKKFAAMRMRHVGTHFIRHVRRGLQHIGLRDAQWERVRSILERARTDARTIFESEDDPAVQRESLTKLRDQVLREVEGLLDAEQKKKWDEMRRRFEARRRSRGV